MSHQVLSLGIPRLRRLCLWHDPSVACKPVEHHCVGTHARSRCCWPSLGITLNTSLEVFCQMMTFSQDIRVEF